jgi:Flp pilus assembly pilin Flp
MFVDLVAFTFGRLAGAVVVPVVAAVRTVRAALDDWWA